MQTTRSVRKNRAIPSRASPLPQDCAAPDVVKTAKPVGAGLPAMVTTRCDRYTASFASRASPLPQYCEAACRCPCGSWFACDANNAVSQEKQGDTLASKPAPTGLRSRLQVPLWELACLRCKRRDQSGKIGRYLREQARSHRTAKSLAGALVGAGLPAMRTTRSLRKNRAIPS